MGHRPVMSVRTEPGWIGLFTRRQAPDAIRNGTAIVKVRTEEGDAHPIGTRGTVLGSIGAPSLGIGYFIEWAERPRMAVFTEGSKIESAK